MDNELNFPNPVERSDLPKRSGRRPWIVLGVLGVVLLAFFLTPQLLGTRPGLSIVSWWMQRNCTATVSVGTFSTSWFSGTRATDVWIRDTSGRRIGCAAIQCDAPLWKLLRGNYALGNATIDKPYIDYVIDHGDGSDTLARLWPGPPSDALPKLSGNIHVTGGTLLLWRGRVAGNLVETNFSATRLVNVNGSCEIAALDQPWTYTLTSDVGGETGATGPIHSSGKLSLGAGGRFIREKISADLTADAHAVPVTALPVLLPYYTEADYRALIGERIDDARLVLAGADGKLKVKLLEMTSALASVKFAGTLDFTAPATVLATNGQGSEISFGFSPRVVNEAIACVNPLLHNAAGAPTMKLRIDDLSLPLSGRGQTILVGWLHSGTVSLPGNDPMPADGLPSNPALCLSMLQGDRSAVPTITPDDEHFVFASGQVKSFQAVRINDTMLLNGSTADDGKLDMRLTLQDVPYLVQHVTGLQGKAIVIPVIGTVAAPVIDLAHAQLPDAALQPAFAQFLAQESADARSRERERIARESEQRMHETLRQMGGDTVTTRP